jgi:heme A synthase
MQGSVAIEHSHRLLATLVGTLTIVLVVLAARLRSLAPRIAKLCYLALGLVIFQGVLGGMTVLLKLSILFSTAHLATSQIFLATMLYIALKTRASQRAPYNSSASLLGSPLGSSISRATVSRATVNWLYAATTLVFLQMVLGAFIRHSGASVTCGLGSDAVWMCVDPVTQTQTWWPSFLPAQIGMLHRYVGFFAVLAVVAGTLPLLRWARLNQQKSLCRLVVGAYAIVGVQVALGLLSLATYLGPFVVTLHLDFAMALWMSLLACSILAREHLSGSSRRNQNNNEATLAWSSTQKAGEAT